MTGSASAADRGPLRPGPLSTTVARLCEQLRAQVGAGTAAGLREVAQRLAAPLQVAVLGRLSAGKSTLVNALIGRRVAPTCGGECTRLVTRFRYGTVDRVEVVFRDGRCRAVPFDAGGMLPAELGADPAEVSHLEAYLTNAVLRELTVIDTPGLGAPTPGLVARAHAVLGSTSSAAVPDGVATTMARAEAVLYVVTQAVRADDTEALAAVTAATGSRVPGPVNTIAVLTKIDTVLPESVPGSHGDLATAAELLAARQAEVLRPQVAGVLPMIGLLAETAETGVFTTADATALAALARIDPVTRATMLLSADLFTILTAPVPVGTRQRLLDLLGLHGVGKALVALDAQPRLSTEALRRMLLAESGLPRLRARLDAVFRARADEIKAAAALASIATLARSADDRSERALLRDAVETLLARPQVHRLRLLEALTEVASPAVPLASDLVEEVLRLSGSADPAEQLGLVGRPGPELARYALARAGWWRSFATVGATPAQSRVAHVVHRSYFLLWQQLRDGHDGRGRGA